ncbi:MAG: sugar kinase [Candidatus Omnitrophica bacterium]|nr:sugar kinase [Candidatus Omnitrophota bacterium]
MEKKKHILVIGSVALDTIETPLGRCREVLGGSAVYFSVCASLFAPVRLVAVVGEDFPSRHKTFLQKRKNVDIEGLVVQKGKTFRWEGRYGWDFGNAETIATHLNVFAQFKPQIPKSYENSEYVFLANIDPELQSGVLTQLRRPQLIVCDTMNFWIENKKKHLLRLLKKVDIFVLNESEARQLSGEANIAKAARAIMSFGPKSLIVKKGEHGAIMFTKDAVFCVPAYLLEEVFDPTGAGDTFAGGFLGYLASVGKITTTTLKQALIYGNIMATFAVNDFSLHCLGSINRGEVKKRYQKFRKYSCF